MSGLSRLFGRTNTLISQMVMDRLIGSAVPGVVFVELLTGEPAFHRDAGQCDGYTEEVVLREIKEVTEESLQRILEQADPATSTTFRVPRATTPRDGEQRDEI